MANVTTYLDNKVPQLGRGLTSIRRAKTLAASGIANGDRVQLFTIPAGTNWRLDNASLKVLATLGASATLKLQVDRAGVYTDITAASTAAAASKVTSAAQTGVPFDLQGGDIISALVAGADVTASAGIEVDLTVSRR